jgi:hypothetical protein
MSLLFSFLLHDCFEFTKTQTVLGNDRQRIERMSGLTESRCVRSIKYSQEFSCIDQAPEMGIGEAYSRKDADC